ncbi:MAG: cupin domain-containing protein, partial [Ruminococcaceae bacterium]|nr:cupin domain-containing protein [Oscillospiraceae bacterium]
MSSTFLPTYFIMKPPKNFFTFLLYINFSLLSLKLLTISIYFLYFFDIICYIYYKEVINMADAVYEEVRNFFYNTTALATERRSLKHYHSMYEIYYLEQGECHYLIEGKLFEMEKGDIVFIPKGMIHKTTYEGPHSRLLINCPGNYLENIMLREAFVYRNEKYTGEIYNV